MHWKGIEMNDLDIRRGMYSNPIIKARRMKQGDRLCMKSHEIQYTLVSCFPNVCFSIPFCISTSIVLISLSLTKSVNQKTS